MKTLTKLTLAVLGSAAVVGCDPYEKAVSGPPAVLSAGFTSVQDGTGYEGFPTAPGVVSVSGVPSTCTGASFVNAGWGNSTTDPTGFVFVKFNKLLNGASIQTTPSDCTPAAALGLVVTPAPPAGLAWYACYTPQAPVPTEGGSVIIYLDAIGGSVGWINAASIPTSGNVATVIHATGTAHDKDGAAAAFDVTVNVDPDPGIPGTLTFTNFAPATNPTSYTISWTAPQCAAVGITYELQRAPDNAGAPGTWTTITTPPFTATTYNETLTTSAITWYRVRAVTTGGFLAAYSTPTTQKPATPAAPTFAAWTATSVTVNWAAVPSAQTYDVQRAPDVGGAPGTFAALTGATGLTVLTFNDTTLTANTKYWYRIVANNAFGSTTGASQTQVPAAPGVPNFTVVTATSVTLTWGSAARTTSFSLQRAPDSAGNPGTWATIATLLPTAPATSRTYTDATVAGATRYWYRMVAVNGNASTNGIAGFVNTP